MCVTYGKLGTSCVSHTGQFTQTETVLNLGHHVCHVRVSLDERRLHNLTFKLNIWGNKKVVDNVKNNMGLILCLKLEQSGKKWKKEAKIEFGNKNSIWRQLRFLMKNLSAIFLPLYPLNFISPLSSNDVENY